jgi:hypothetical protein
MFQKSIADGYGDAREDVAGMEPSTGPGTSTTRKFAFGAMLLLTNCSPPVTGQEDQSSNVQQLERDLAARDAEIDTLKELLVEERVKPRQTVTAAVADKATGGGSLGNAAQAQPVAAPAPSRYPDMCYKDYCPCKGPQGGPDEVLCDQLEQGTDPSADLMIAGRKMRQARREVAAGKR